jgi:GH24 family phage-related lysozyme (muramidase)
VNSTVDICAVAIALLRLRTEEGFRTRAYKDTNGFTTIGYGFNVDAGITPRAATALLQEQLQEAHETLLKLTWYTGLDPVRQSVCVDIDLNEGEGGLLRFPHMITALVHQDWPTAATECHVEDPRLASRYVALAKILLTGEA